MLLDSENRVYAVYKDFGPYVVPMGIYQDERFSTLDAGAIFDAFANEKGFTDFESLIYNAVVEVEKEQKRVFDAKEREEWYWFIKSRYSVKEVDL